MAIFSLEMTIMFLFMTVIRKIGPYVSAQSLNLSQECFAGMSRRLPNSSLPKVSSELSWRDYDAKSAIRSRAFRPLDTHVCPSVKIEE